MKRTLRIIPLCLVVSAAEAALPTAPVQNEHTDTWTYLREGWVGKTGFGYALTYPEYYSGVFQFAEVGIESHRHRFIASSEASGVVQGGNIRRTNGVLNAGYDITFDRLRAFVFTNYEFGVIVGLDSNTALGAGVRYTALKFEKFHLDLSAAPVYDRTAYADDTLYESLSVSMRGRIKIFFTENDSLFISWFHIRGLDRPNNQWHAADVINSNAISTKVSVRTGYRWRYDVFSEASSGLGYLMAVFSFT